MSANRGDAISKIVNDESLLGIRRAYYELELFQLTETHLMTKELLKERIAEIRQQQSATEESAAGQCSEPV